MRCLFVATFVFALATYLVRGQDAEEARQQQLDARLQQYVQLLTPSMWNELDLVRQICDLTPEQRPVVKAAAEAAVKEAAKVIVQPQAVGVRNQIAVVQRSQPTYGNQVIHDKLSESLKTILNEDQWKHYEQEDAARTAAKRKTTITATVALLDNAVYLSHEQREKISEALDKNWQREWEQWITMHQYNGQYFPQVPEQHVVPYLTAEQKVVWDGMQKIMINGWNNNRNRPPDDAWWNGNGPPAAKAAAKNTMKNAGKAALLKPPQKKG